MDYRGTKEVEPYCDENTNEFHKKELEEQYNMNEFFEGHEPPHIYQSSKDDPNYSKELYF